MVSAVIPIGNLNADSNGTLASLSCCIWETNVEYTAKTDSGDEPIALFGHFNVEKLRMSWQIIHFDQSISDAMTVTYVQIDAITNFVYIFIRQHELEWFL